MWKASTCMLLSKEPKNLELMVVGLGRHQIILGMPWLKTWNPHIDWKSHSLSFLTSSPTDYDEHILPQQYLLHWLGVKTRIGLLAETPETQSLLGHGTWPQLMCCALVAVRVPEVGRGRVGALEQGGSLDSDQDSERRGGNKLKASETRGIRPKQAGGC